MSKRNSLQEGDMRSSTKVSIFSELYGVEVHKRRSIVLPHSPQYLPVRIVGCSDLIPAGLLELTTSEVIFLNSFATCPAKPSIYFLSFSYFICRVV
jgi:hypothetical protein